MAFEGSGNWGQNHSNIYIYGGWSKHSCRCVIRNDLAPALALPCALQGFYCVPLHRLKYVFKNWLPQKVAQFKEVFTDPVRCATQTFLAFGSKIWWFGARILRSWRFWGALLTEEIWFPKRPFWARKKLYRNQISRGMVEGECIYTEEIWFPKRPFRARKQLYGNQISRGIVEGKYIHVGNLIPKTALLSQKEALRESNFKRYGRRRVYTQRKFDSQNGHFEPERSFTGIKFQEVW